MATESWFQGGRLYVRTVALAAKGTGIPETTLRRWLQEGCPGERGRYCIPAIVEWARVNRWCEGPTESDGSEAVSPMLEKWREERWKQAQMETRRMSGELVAVADLHGMLMQMAGLIRGIGEQLRRQFGNDALQILNEALDEFERIAEGIGGGNDDGQ